MSSQASSVDKDDEAPSAEGLVARLGGGGGGFLATRDPFLLAFTACLYSSSSEVDGEE